MKHKIILTRTFVTEFEIEAEDNIEAELKFKELGDAIYQQELEQCNVISETVVVDSDEGIRICSITNEEMREVWVVNDGELYFKYEKDALAWCIANEYEDIQSAYNDDVIYWTEWETNNLINNL